MRRRTGEPPKRQPLDADTQKIVDDVRATLVGFRPEFGNQNHIWLLDRVKMFDAELRKAKPNKSDLKRWGSNIISTIQASRKND